MIKRLILILFFALFLASSAYAISVCVLGGGGGVEALSVAQSESTASVTGALTCVDSFTSTPAVNSLIVVGISCYEASAGDRVTGVSDNQGNSYSLAVKYQHDSQTDFASYIYYAVAETSSGTFTVTVTASTSSFITMGINEIRGVSTTPTVSTNGVNNGSGTDVSSGAVSPSGDNIYIGTMSYYYGAFTITEDGDWSLLQEEESGATVQSLSNIYKITTGSQNAGWTLSSTDSWVGLIASFK